MAAGPVDDHLGAMVLRRLARRHPHLEVPRADEIEECEDHVAAMRRLARSYLIEGAISRSQFLAERAALDDALQGRRREREQPTGWRLVDELGGPATARRGWSGLSDAQKRTIIDSEVRRVIVRPRGPTGHKIDFGRLTVLWWASQADLLDIADVSVHLGLSVSTIYRWLQQGTLPGQLLNGRWRVRRDDLEVFVEARRHRGGSDDNCHVDRSRGPGRTIP